MEIRVIIRDRALDGYLDYDNVYYDSKNIFSAFYHDSYFKKKGGLVGQLILSLCILGKLGSAEVWQW